MSLPAAAKLQCLSTTCWTPTRMWFTRADICCLQHTPRSMAWWSHRWILLSQHWNSLWSLSSLKHSLLKKTNRPPLREEMYPLVHKINTQRGATSNLGQHPNINFRASEADSLKHFINLKPFCKSSISNLHVQHMVNIAFFTTGQTLTSNSLPCTTQSDLLQNN